MKPEQQHHQRMAVSSAGVQDWTEWRQAASERVVAETSAGRTVANVKMCKYHPVKWQDYYLFLNISHFSGPMSSLCVLLCGLLYPWVVIIMEAFITQTCLPFSLSHWNLPETIWVKKKKNSKQSSLNMCGSLNWFLSIVWLTHESNAQSPVDSDMKPQRLTSAPLFTSENSKTSSSSSWMRPTLTAC